MFLLPQSGGTVLNILYQGDGLYLLNFIEFHVCVMCRMLNSFRSTFRCNRFNWKTIIQQFTDELGLCARLFGQGLQCELKLLVLCFFILLQDQEHILIKTSSYKDETFGRCLICCGRMINDWEKAITLTTSKHLILFNLLFIPYYFKTRHVQITLGFIVDLIPVCK